MQDAAGPARPVGVSREVSMNEMSIKATWSVTGKKDRQIVRSDWQPSDPIAIEDVRFKVITSVLTDNGTLTEVFRHDWQLDDRPVQHVFQRLLEPGGISAWHMHRLTTDRLFCAFGRVKVVLFDARIAAASHGAVAEFRMGRERPGLLVIPPGVWHGVQSLGTEPALMLNVVDHAYDYEDPDHYRVPQDSPEVPYRFAPLPAR
jgi:dTDP-4-dehydrorhamnose 3,5-epimerase